MTGQALPTCDVLGVRCIVGDVDSACAGVVDHALAGAGGYGVLCNVHVLMTAQRTPQVMDALQCAWAVFPDGAPVAWFQRRMGRTSARRIGGPDLMPLVLDRGRAHDLRHVLFGSTPAVVEQLRRRLETMFPGVQIVATCPPELGGEDDDEVLGRLADSNAHVIWCALGAPKQELWMARQAAALAPALVLGVGAAFDFHAETKARAPRWMQRVGLEWLHRLGTEPRRLALRYAVTNVAFVVAAAPRVLRKRLA